MRDPLTTTTARVLDRLEKRMEAGFTEVHGAFSKLVDRVESAQRESDARFRQLETGQASSGKLSWGAIATGVTVLIVMLTPITGWISTSTENRVLRHELSQITYRIDLENRITLLEKAE